MSAYHVPPWKEAPFLRLILPFTGGILLQWYTHIPVWIYWMATPVCLVAVILFVYIRSFSQFSLYNIAGLFIHLLLLCAGGLITHYKDIRHQENWINHTRHTGASYVVTLEEPLSRKTASYKAVGSIDYICREHHSIRTSGRMLLYFANDSSLANLTYHSRIAFSKPLQDITNTGNPGGFNYRQYCAFQNIHHQVYLKPGDYICLPAKTGGTFTSLLLGIRTKIVGILHTYIARKESGLAEALLIGYKDDLDKELVQSYANTGVVHIIAISGLHLGLIYWLLTQLFSFMKRSPVRWLAPALIIVSLWIFSLLTGGSPSVMRSAVMFTFIVAGQYIGKNSTVYNSLAASAFLLLCYNPFWLWDAGFQLSYLAVLSIVLFMRPVYNWFYVKNKLLDGIVKMFATTMAAQVLTMPVSVYLFHQFPVYFLLTNMIAVPLSSLIVLGEIMLCACSWMPVPATYTGMAVSWLISVMNRFVAYMEHLPFSMWGRLNISLFQTGLLYTAIIALCAWLLLRKRLLLPVALVAIICFMLIRMRSFILCSRQQQLIVYNVSRHQAMDIVSGHNAVFIADKALHQNPALLRMNTAPAGILYRFSYISRVQSDGYAIQGFCLAGKRILLCSQFMTVQPGKKIAVDVVIITGNPRGRIADLLEATDCGTMVFDSSNPAWKVQEWKAVCEKAGVKCYAVAEKGAFVFKAD